MGRKTNLLLILVISVFATGALLPAGSAAVDASFLINFLSSLDANGYDVTGDGSTDFRDLMQVALHWGEENVVATPSPTPTEVGGTLTPTATPTQPATTDTPTDTSTATPTSTPTQPTPTDTPTATPTEPGGTPTATPTPHGNTFSFGDFFPMGVGDTWHYVGDPGASQEDNFRWTVLQAKKDVGGGIMATDIHTTVDDPNDLRDGDEDFWYLDPQGNMYYYGLRNGNPDPLQGGVTFPAQDVIFTDPVLIGHANMTIGETVADTGAGSLVIQPIGTISASFTSNAKFTEFEPTHVTALGTFSNVLRLELTIDAQVTLPIIGTVTITARKSTFFFKEGVGMIAQDQAPDPNDAEAQSIDSGTVNGQPVVAGKARAK